MIISVLTGRPVGTEIQPEDQEAYELNMLEYIKSIELIGTSTLIGVAVAGTVPVQPSSTKVCYIAGMSPSETLTFANFLGQNGSPLSVTTAAGEGKFIVLLWNTQYWEASSFVSNLSNTVVQEKGTSTVNVMSQKAVTDEIEDLELKSNMFGVATGTAQAITLTVPTTISALAAGMRFTFRPVAANTASDPTLNVNSLGAKTIKRGSDTFYNNSNYYSNDVIVNDIRTGVYAVVEYDGTNFHLMNPQKNRNAPYSDFIVSVKSTDLNLPDNIELAIDYIYRNDPDYGSGIRVYSYIKDTNAQQIIECYYVDGNAKTTSNGIKTISLYSTNSGYGSIQLTVNWNCIPNGYNKLLDVPIILSNKYTTCNNTDINYLNNIINQNYSSLEDSLVQLNPILLLDVSYFTIDGYIGIGGGASTNSLWKRTDYIPITSIDDININVRYLDSNNIYVFGVAFFSETKNAFGFISGIQDQPSTSLLILKPDDIPENAKYVVFSAYTQDVNFSKVYASITFDKLASAVIENAGAKSIANEALQNSLIAISRTATEDVVHGLDDGDYYSVGYGQYGIGEYIRPENEDYNFDSILLRQINISSSCEYKIYLVNNVTAPAYCPTGVIGLNHTLVQEGTLEANNVYGDVKIQLNQTTLCPAGVVIGIYLRCASKVYVRGTNNSAPSQELVNFQLFSTSAYNDIWGSTWYDGYNLYAAISAWAVLNKTFVTVSDLQPEIEQYTTPLIESTVDQIMYVNLDIQLPEKIYAIEGVEMNIWNDTVTLSVDKGIVSPMNYSVQWICYIGLVTERGYRFTPSASNVGDHWQLTCILYDVFGNELKQKNTTIYVLGKDALSSDKNIVYFGDSLGASAASCLYQDFHNNNMFTGNIPKMLGTQTMSGAHFEAIGGYEWMSYATAGETCFRVPVTGITSIAINSIYTDSTNKSFIVKEVNIVDGVGNILLFKHYAVPTYSYGELLMPDGTLNKVDGSGDNTINYSGAFTESTNPLWDNDLQSLNMLKYKTTLVNTGQLSSINDKIDAVSFQFGINDRRLATNLPLLLSYIDALYQCFIGDNANCKFIIGLTTTCGNTMGGAGANYGATWNNALYSWQVYTIRNFLLTLQNSLIYPNIRIAPINCAVDRYYGYSFSERPISARYTTNESYHNNCVHPGTSGYFQIADSYFGTYIGVLIEE